MQYVLAGKHYHPVKLTGIVVPYKWLPGKCIDSRGLYNCPTFNECRVYTVDMLQYCSMQSCDLGKAIPDICHFFYTVKFFGE